jgi:hypothetical protein
MTWFQNLRYDRAEPIHLLILQSIYSRLMGGPLSCPALGAHWMDVGFNHPDPAIDLTSAKMLGAVSLLFFITQYPTLAEDGKNFLKHQHSIHEIISQISLAY